MTGSDKDVCDEKDFNAIFREIAPVLRNFLYYKFKEIDQAGDIVQEAFLVLWRNCKKVTPVLAKSYLFKVAQNQFLKTLGKEKTHEKYLDLQIESTPEDPSFVLEHKELNDRLLQAIEELPDSQREVFLMNRIENKTYAEIAEVLEVSVKAIEKRMHKALIKLREICYKI